MLLHLTLGTIAAPVDPILVSPHCLLIPYWYPLLCLALPLLGPLQHVLLWA